MAPVLSKPEPTPLAPSCRPLKPARPPRRPGKAHQHRPSRPLGADLPLREGIGSLERWLDLNA